MFFPRIISAEARALSEQYPVVTITGPRQSGKTTLAKVVFPEKPYVNLEQPDIRQIARLDPMSFLAKYPAGAILDEIQRVPELLSYIQVIVDQRSEKGLFILTGSHQHQLREGISQSLAGRTALLFLLPLSLEELDSRIDPWDLVLKGMMPRIHAENLDPTKAYRNYYQTYVERDVRQLINVKDINAFERFMRLIAGRVGQLFNADSLANETGVSYHTIQNWMSVLEASYILLRLNPYFENFNKRVVKTPKLYFAETGLATYLLGIETREQLERDPLRGQLFENFIVAELFKYRFNRGLEPRLFFFRDHSGNEIDLLYHRAHHLVPVEIKSAMTFQADYLRTLRLFRKWLTSRVPQSFLIYTGNTEQVVDQTHVINFRNLHQVFQ